MIIYCKDCRFLTCDRWTGDFTCTIHEGMGEILDPATDFCSHAKSHEPQTEDSWKEGLDPTDIETIQNILDEHRGRNSN